MLVRGLGLMALISLSVVQSLASDNHLYLTFISRHQKDIQQMQSFMLSPAQTYKGKQSGLDIYCFWTQDKDQIEKYIAAKNELTKNDASLSYSSEVQWDMQFVLPQYSGKIFSAGPAGFEEKITLHRACISVFPEALQKEKQLRKTAVDFYEHIEKIQSLISLLEILEKDPSRYAPQIEKLNSEILSLINNVKSSQSLSEDRRKEFLSLLEGSPEGNSNLRSKEAHKILIESLVEKDNFVPEHRYGTFLAQLFENHKHIIKAHPSTPMIWTRQQIWNSRPTNDLIIDFRITNKQELCENYFSYSLPIFLNSVAKKIPKRIKTEATDAAIVKSVTEFREKLIPILSQDCAFKDSIAALDKILADILIELAQTPSIKISETEVAKIEWDLYFPSQPFLQAKYNSIADIYLHTNPEQRTFTKESARAIRLGDLKFIPIQNTTEAATLLSRFGIKYYQGQDICMYFISPLLNLNGTAGNQYEYFHSCIKDQGHEEKNLVWLRNSGKEGTVLGNKIALGINNGNISITFKDYQNTEGLQSQYQGMPFMFLLNSISIKGGKNLNKEKFRICEVPNTKLSYQDFSNCNFERVNFKGLNLMGTNLSGANLEGADLRDTDFSGANLSGAHMNGALYNQKDSIKNQNGTKFPENISEALGINKMIPYDYCSWGYDRHCAHTSENPRECLKRALKHHDLPISCTPFLEDLPRVRPALQVVPLAEANKAMQIRQQDDEFLRQFTGRKFIQRYYAIPMDTQEAAMERATKYCETKSGLSCRSFGSQCEHLHNNWICSAWSYK